MAAGLYSFTIEQGATFDRTFTYKNASDVLVNLTGYTARMQVRTTEESSVIIFELTTENGGITLGGVAGTIRLFLTATATAALAAAAGLVYDLELVSGTTVTRLLYGTVGIDREVTR